MLIPCWLVNCARSVAYKHYTHTKAQGAQSVCFACFLLLHRLRGLRAVWVLQDEKERNMAREKETRRERPLQSYSNHMQMRLRTPHEKWIINHLAPLGQSEGKALITPSSKRGGEQAPRCVRRHRERCFPHILITQSHSPKKHTAWAVRPYSSCLIIYQ